MIPARQLWLQLGPESHFDLLHGQHQARVGLAHSSAQERWNDHGGTVDHETAKILALDLASRRDFNAYITQAGFSGKRRVTPNVSALAAFYVDLDTYNVPGLESLSTDELLDRILAQHPWLPVPTMRIASGRGHYLVWSLVRPLDRQHLADWQAVEVALIDLLIPFGADPHAKDAARVLRIVGSVNQKNGAEVIGYQTGPAVTFERFSQLVLAHAAPIITPARKPRLEVVEQLEEDFDGNLVPVKVSNATARQRAQRLKPFRLAQDRMHDYGLIASMRGSPRMQDYRHRLLYHYATSGAFFWSTIDQAQEELDYFASQHFAGADRYNARRVQSVLDRMEKDLTGRVARIEGGVRLDWRYHLGNATIIRALEITAQEQRQLRTIIGKDERQRRRTERRRDAGMAERGQWLTQAQERRSSALLMRSRGMTQSAIARELGITQGRVSQILKGSGY